MKGKTAGTAVALTILVGSCVYAGPKPTHPDVEYSKQYGRSRMDVWLPQGTNAPCPVIVYFHGGGFTGGDKSQFASHRILSEYPSNGVAYASVNYPLLSNANYLTIMAHAAESIKFLKAQSTKWNIDSDRIAVMGSSAGAMIAEYLAYWQNLGITGCFAEEQPHRSWFLLAFVTKGGPPLILYTQSGPNDEVHHPDNARRFKTHCDAVGITCELYGSKASGLPALPDGLSIEKRVMQVFGEQWKQRKATADMEKPGAPPTHNKPDAGASQ